MGMAVMALVMTMLAPLTVHAHSTAMLAAPVSTRLECN
jgi:hypothetical protein